MLINLRNALMAGKRLPYDAELEYLKSTGTQWVDTGIVANGYTTTYLTACNTRYDTTSWIFGSRESWKSKGYSIYNGEDQDDKYTVSYGNVDTSSSVISNISSRTGKITQFTLGRYTSIDTWTQSYPFYQFETPGTCILFGARNNGVINPGYARIYCCKIYQNGVLVRDYIPVRRGTVGYLYDRVSGKLFGNAGTGDFVLGPDVVPVEYIESHGTEWIDTGTTGDLTTELTCEASITQAGSASVTNIMGNNVTSTRAITINMSANITNPSISRIRFGDKDTTTVAGSINLNTFYKYTINKDNLTVQDIGGTILNTYALNSTTAFTTNGNILIYKLGDTLTQYIGKIKVSRASIKNNDTPIRSFRPVRVGTEGAMMDVLTRRIYRNAGTGAFGYGNDLKYPIPAE